MGSKVVDFDPTKRLNKEAFEEFQSRIKNLKLEEVDAITVIYKPFNDIPSVQSFGLDWSTIAITRAVLDAFSQELLQREFDGSTFNDNDED